MRRPVNRVAPNGPASAYQTYQVASPTDRTVVAACEWVGCEKWARGWVVPVDERTDLGRAQAAYIRTRSGRTFREQRTATGLTVFRFDSKQRCFDEHRTRPASFLVRGGDWRAYGQTIRRHANGRDWVEDFGEHQQRIADQREKG